MRHMTSVKCYLGDPLTSGSYPIRVAINGPACRARTAMETGPGEITVWFEIGDEPQPPLNERFLTGDDRRTVTVRLARRGSDLVFRGYAHVATIVMTDGEVIHVLVDHEGLCEPSLEEI